TDVILDTRSLQNRVPTRTKSKPPDYPQELRANLLTILETLGQQTSGVAWFDDWYVCPGNK
ncbi:hypothetical protein HispidOSU_005230, partial [Sigmodon hispidus]